MTTVERGRGRDEGRRKGPKCGAKTRTGPGTCTQAAGWGTDHVGYGNCKLHGGCTPTGAKGAKRQRLGDELARMGVQVEIDPTEAMLEMVWEAAGNVAFLRARVQELDQAVEHQALETLERPDHLGAALAGRVDPDTWKAARHIWVAMYDDERERLVRFAKMCRDAGVEEHRVHLAEQQGQQLAAVLRGVFAAVFEALAVLAGARTLDLATLRRTWDQQLPEIVRAQIAAVTAPETPAA